MTSEALSLSSGPDPDSNHCGQDPHVEEHHAENGFTSLGLGKALTEALLKKGYDRPTPIQAQAIPRVLSGADLLATAQTGTGKTASFALPLLERLHTKRRAQHEKSKNDAGKRKKRAVRALVLTPTRELAEQIHRNVQYYAMNTRLRSIAVVGGVPLRKQIQRLQKTPDVVVATPGRLIDLLGQGVLSLGQVETLVLDEADRMLDMGFIPDVKKIAGQTPKDRQTLLFSATMSQEVEKLSAALLRSPERIAIQPAATIADNLEQSVFFVEQAKKGELLCELLRDLPDARVLVFTRTKRRANLVAELLSKRKIPAEAIHSNKSQGARRRALASFDRGEVQVLVATDVVARGIDVKEISHVINFELPDELESYVHRIGRTARAQRSGVAFSFCSSSEVGTLQAVEKLIRKKLSVYAGHDFHSQAAENRYESPQKRVIAGRGGGGGSRPGRGRKPRDSSGSRGQQRRRGPGGPSRRNSRGRKRRGAASLSAMFVASLFFSHLLSSPQASAEGLQEKQGLLTDFQSFRRALQQQGDFELDTFRVDEVCLERSASVAECEEIIDRYEKRLIELARLAKTEEEGAPAASEKTTVVIQDNRTDQLSEWERLMLLRRRSGGRPSAGVQDRPVPRPVTPPPASQTSPEDSYTLGDQLKGDRSPSE